MFEIFDFFFSFFFQGIYDKISMKFRVLRFQAPCRFLLARLSGTIEMSDHVPK